MAKQTSPNPLAERLAVLGIEAAELAAIVKRPADEVEGWVSGDSEPDAEARVLLRLVMDPERAHAAALAVQRVRDSWTADLRGDGVAYAGIETPGYGSGHQGETGGRPQ